MSAELFAGKYRIPSARLPGWDYGSAAMYFVTVCTAGRVPFFGEIQHGTMCLSAIGAVTYNEWLDTPAHRPDMNLQLGEFVVMPNHFHAILIIGENAFNTPGIGVSVEDILDGDRDASIASLRRVYKNAFAPQAKNLGSVMRGFKSAVTSFAKDEALPFGWQSRFHDHIIRSYEEYLRIYRYISENIRNWKSDCFCS
jgi:REP element-mobilizing transposase RayT